MARTDILDEFEFDDNQFFENGDEGEVVAKYFSSLEAEVAAARLRSEGIPCFLANTVSHSVLPNLNLVIRLHTRPQDSARAREILAEAAAETAQFTPRSSTLNMLWAIVILLAIFLVTHWVMLQLRGH
jgi:hypothetical protein